MSGNSEFRCAVARIGEAMDPEMDRRREVWTNGRGSLKPVTVLGRRPAQDVLWYGMDKRSLAGSLTWDLERASETKEARHVSAAAAPFSQASSSFSCGLQIGADVTTTCACTCRQEWLAD